MVQHEDDENMIVNVDQDDNGATPPALGLPQAMQQGQQATPFDLIQSANFVRQLHHQQQQSALIAQQQQQQMSSASPTPASNEHSPTSQSSNQHPATCAAVVNHQSMDPEKRVRREIANSNERRRMQSINCGFHTLREMLPPTDVSDKMSKAAILQQTADYIDDLRAEKKELVDEIDNLKRSMGKEVSVRAVVPSSVGSPSSSSQSSLSPKQSTASPPALIARVPPKKRKRTQYTAHSIESCDEGVVLSSEDGHGDPSPPIVRQPKTIAPVVVDANKLIGKQILDSQMAYSNDQQLRQLIEEQMQRQSIIDAQQRQSTINQICALQQQASLKQAVDALNHQQLLQQQSAPPPMLPSQTSPLVAPVKLEALVQAVEHLKGVDYMNAQHDARNRSIIQPTYNSAFTTNVLNEAIMSAQRI